jgi:hypothetical protein
VGQGDDWSIQLSEIGGVDTFDSATIGTSPTVVTTTTNQHEFPEYILVVSLWPTGSGSYNPAPNIPLWTALNAPATLTGFTLSNVMCFGRQVDR